MSAVSSSGIRLPLGKGSMARLRAEAKRAGVNPAQYACELVESALNLRREAEEKSFAQILSPVRRASGRVTDAEVVRLVEKVRAKRNDSAHRRRKG